MFKNRTGIKKITVSVSSNEFDIVAGDLNGASHYLIESGRAIDINGLLIAPFYGDQLMRQAWAIINTTGTNQLKNLDAYITDPAAPLDDSILMVPGTFNAQEVTGITGISQLELVIVCYA